MASTTGSNWFRRFLLPGLVFQSVVIAGGYGTGRELAEFFLGYGPRLGLLSMVLVATTVWSGVAAVSFEFAREVGATDYREFFRALIGRGWVLFEIAYIGILIIVMAVVASASGAIAQETFGLNYRVGVFGIIVAIGVLVFLGSSAVERVFAGWSGLLYAVYIILFVWAMARFGPEIGDALRLPPPSARPATARRRSSSPPTPPTASPTRSTGNSAPSPAR